MKITTITYKRVHNIGNYQSQTFEFTAEVQENELPLKVAEQLRFYVLEALGISDAQPF